MKNKKRTVAFRDRIKELRRVKASVLRANPKNWRRHPESQKKAVRGVLESIGFADAALARKDEDGSLVLLDGHLRQDLAGDQEIPVLVLDVTEEEGDLILATLDPLAARAETDPAMLGLLLDGVRSDNVDVEALLAELVPVEASSDSPAEGVTRTATESRGRVTTQCPKCGHRWRDVRLG